MTPANPTTPAPDGAAPATPAASGALARLAGRLRGWLADPRLTGVSIDDPLIIVRHREILREKKAMQQVFAEFYDLCHGLDERLLRGDGARVEIGAGSSFFKQAYPHIVSTDIKPAAHLDRVVDALAMPFEGGTVRSFYCINCFHHFPDPSRFFAELQRTLQPGGGAVLIEPYFGALGGTFYQHVFAVEHFNKRQEHWDRTDAEHFVGANQALSYVVFFRDRERWQREFPDLEIALARPIDNYLRYLLSGGLNFRQLVPDFTLPLVRLCEKLLIPVRRLLALHHVIVIRKRTS